MPHIRNECRFIAIKVVGRQVDRFSCIDTENVPNDETMKLDNFALYFISFYEAAYPFITMSNFS